MGRWEYTPTARVEVGHVLRYGCGHRSRRGVVTSVVAQPADRVAITCDIDGQESTETHSTVLTTLERWVS